jgi:ubiquinone/menaquinone biosynthesis C-methylase UbiE
MIEYALRQPCWNIAYSVGAAENIPYEEALFDAVTCFSAFHWFNANLALDEIRRVLKPKGLIAITNKNETSNLKNEFRQLLSHFVIGDLPDVKKKYDPLRELQIHAFSDITKHVEIVSELLSTLEATAYFQSVSLWNLIPNSLKLAALSALEEFCKSRSIGGFVAREVAVETILATT